MASQAQKQEQRWLEYKKKSDVSVEQESAYNRIHMFANTVDTDVQNKVFKILSND